MDLWSILGDLIGFLIKAVIFLSVTLIIIRALAQGFKGGSDDGLIVTHLNEKFKTQESWLKRMLMTPEARRLAERAEEKREKGARRAERKEAKKNLKSKSEIKDDVDHEAASPKLFVIKFKGDIQASAIEQLREEITAILQIYEEGDEVLLCLDNSGGYVHTHGLAASQLTRIKSAGLKLTVAIDKVAASGGYMMACVGEQIIAAPFAIVGSIGVVAQVPNVNRFLKRYDVDVELHTAGKYKRTLTMLGENTEEGRAKFIEDLEKTHGLFQAFVSEQRPQLDIELVSTGETWYGRTAVDVGLIDQIMTSDEFILRSVKSHEVFQIEYRKKKRARDQAMTWLHTLAQGRLPEA